MEYGRMAEGFEHRNTSSPKIDFHLAMAPTGLVELGTPTGSWEDSSSIGVFVETYAKGPAICNSDS